MGHFSVEIITPPGSTLSGNQHHTNIENTVRYLGVDVDDALTLSERTDI